MVDRSQSLVLVTLLGTRIFPNPSVYDVVMDLRAETVPFLGGEAHSGMVIGTRNILDKSFTVLKETVEDNPGYSILVVGYSLGKTFCILPLHLGIIIYTFQAPVWPSFTPPSFWRMRSSGLSFPMTS